MKIRNGWVGNSSSSSFIIVGVMIDTNEDNKFVKHFNTINSDLNYPDIDEFIDSKLGYSNELYTEHGLDDYGYETIFIGVNPDKMKEEETLRSFKKRIADKINKEFDFNLVEDKDIHLYSDQGYN